MKNLAGNPDCDHYIKKELERCGIEVIKNDNPSQGEVAWTLEGRLGLGYQQLKLTRNWYYWVVKGQINLVLAKMLYNNPVGKTDIRVAGHCGCPPPEAPWVTWVAPDGREVISEEQEEKFDRLSHLDFVDKEKYHFNDDPRSIGAYGYVGSYHIDSELGLYIFAEHVRGWDTYE